MSIALWNKQNGDQLVASTTALVLTHCWCGLPVGIPENLYRWAREHTEQGIYCPLGHRFVFSDTTEKKLARAKDRAARLQAQLDQTDASLRATKAAKTRFKNQRDSLAKRASAGVCPCCNRTFQQLARHMEAKHPGFAQPGVSEAEPGSPDHPRV